MFLTNTPPFFLATNSMPRLPASNVFSTKPLDLRAVGGDLDRCPRPPPRFLPPRPRPLPSLRTRPETRPWALPGRWGALKNCNLMGRDAVFNVFNTSSKWRWATFSALIDIKRILFRNRLRYSLSATPPLINCNNTQPPPLRRGANSNPMLPSPNVTTTVFRPSFECSSALMVSSATRNVFKGTNTNMIGRWHENREREKERSTKHLERQGNRGW